MDYLTLFKLKNKQTTIVNMFLFFSKPLTTGYIHEMCKSREAVALLSLFSYPSELTMNSKCTCYLKLK